MWHCCRQSDLRNGEATYACACAEREVEEVCAATVALPRPYAFQWYARVARIVMRWVWIAERRR